jgi:hypothetical protein
VQDSDRFHLSVLTHPTLVQHVLDLLFVTQRYGDAGRVGQEEQGESIDCTCMACLSAHQVELSPVLVFVFSILHSCLKPLLLSHWLSSHVFVYSLSLSLTVPSGFFLQSYDSPHGFVHFLRAQSRSLGT